MDGETDNIYVYVTYACLYLYIQRKDVCVHNTCIYVMYMLYTDMYIYAYVHLHIYYMCMYLKRERANAPKFNKWGI